MRHSEPDSAATNGELDWLLSVYLAEYEKLKDEQIVRIGFRDNLIYATLIAIGSILSFTFSDPLHYQALLVLPLATVVLGWTYLNNDQKISTISRYVRVVLAARLRAITKESQARLFEWEHVYKTDQRRGQRKMLQLIINESLFVGSGIIALVSFMKTAPLLSQGIFAIVGLELFALGVLGIEIIIQADFRRNNTRIA